MICGAKKSNFVVGRLQRSTGPYFGLSESYLTYEKKYLGKTSLLVHWPGIEPGPPVWQARTLPLNHQCSTSSIWFYVWEHFYPYEMKTLDNVLLGLLTFHARDKRGKKIEFDNRETPQLSLNIRDQRRTFN